jgi:hypothetical protein
MRRSLITGASSGIEHLTKQIPSWIWVSLEQVFRETETASINGYSKVILGMLYRVVSIFFIPKVGKFIWKLMNGRK